jgi:hypothetical protein
MDERKPGSAFSKGDMLALDSNSSLSRLNPYALAAGTLYGIALTDSIRSIRDLCSCIVIQPNTYFWAALEAGDTPTTGDESGVSFDVDVTGRYFVDGSSTTNAVIVVEGVERIDQSVQSKVIVQFKYADSELDLS